MQFLPSSRAVVDGRRGPCDCARFLQAGGAHAARLRADACRGRRRGGRRDRRRSPAGRRAGGARSPSASLALLGRAARLARARSASPRWRAVAAADGARARDRALAPPLAAWFDATPGRTTARATLVTVAGARCAGRRRARRGRRPAAHRRRRACATPRAGIAHPDACRRTSRATLRRRRARGVDRRPPRSDAPVLLRRPPSISTPAVQSPLAGAAPAVRPRRHDQERRARRGRARRLVATKPAAAVRRRVRDAARRYLAPTIRASRRRSSPPSSSAIAPDSPTRSSAGCRRPARITSSRSPAATSRCSPRSASAAAAPCRCDRRALGRSSRSGRRARVRRIVGGRSVGDARGRRRVRVSRLSASPASSRARCTCSRRSRLLVAIADPLTVIDVGAWLSFGATLGIILCGRSPALLARRAVPPCNRSSGSGVPPPAGPLVVGVAAARRRTGAAADRGRRVSARQRRRPRPQLRRDSGDGGRADRRTGHDRLRVAGGSAAASASAAASRACRRLHSPARRLWSTLAPWLSWRVPPRALAGRRVLRRRRSWRAGDRGAGRPLISLARRPTGRRADRVDRRGVCAVVIATAPASELAGAAAGAGCASR